MNTLSHHRDATSRRLNEPALMHTAEHQSFRRARRRKRLRSRFGLEGG